MSALAPWTPLLPAGTTAERTAALELMLATPAGRVWRAQVGAWITGMVPVELLVPEAASRWRPLVHDAIQFLFSRLSARRLAEKLVEQAELPAETHPEARLLKLISRMPALQKMGQVIARNPRLAPSLRTALIELENGMSDVTAREILGLIRSRLGPRLAEHDVKMERAIFSEASVSAVVRFTCREPGRERKRGVFKVLKPHTPDCLSEEMNLLQELGKFLSSEERGYSFAIRDVKEMIAEVRILLEHELDFAREQATLVNARRIYQPRIGIRVPRLFRGLSTDGVTAMSEEAGVKVTNACRRSPIRRIRIARQLIEALIAAPLFSREDEAIFHGDPHAGNLLYDEPNRELVVLDWALAERLDRESRRRLVLLVLMVILRNEEAVVEAVCALSTGPGRRVAREKLIGREVSRFFSELPRGYSPGTLDAMRLLDDIAIEGVRFPASLFLFRKMLFTLDGVLNDIAGEEVRIDRAVTREFITRWLASFGLFYAPLRTKDLAVVPWEALFYPWRALKAAGRVPPDDAPHADAIEKPAGRGKSRRRAPARQ